MVLGVYWYYGFPAGLYHFDYFRFRPGRGGHADGPAELTVTVGTTEPAALLHELRQLASTYPETNLFVYQHETAVRIELGDYGLFDYTFHVAGEVEAILRRRGLSLVLDQLFPASSFQRLTPEPPTQQLPRQRLLQLVASAPKRQQAETRLLRLDCHLARAQQPAFLRKLDELCQQARLDVLYYFEYELPKDVNLMVFFGNGRQGLAGQPLRYTDAAAFETEVLQALQTHGGQTGHLGGFPKQYPQRGPHVVRITDADFVL